MALSLSRVMADKVGEFLIRAKVRNGAVVLIGGVTRNRHFLRFLGEAWPQTQFVVPEEATYFEAFGAAHLARVKAGRWRPGISWSARPGRPQARPSPRWRRRHRASPAIPRGEPRCARAPTTSWASTAARRRPRWRWSTPRPSRSSAAHYGRTHGDPVAALQAMPGRGPGAARRRTARGSAWSRPPGRRASCSACSWRPTGSTTRSSRTPSGTTYFEPDVDTIFEIGGQDAKYVCINNGVPIDYAMNEACSAGTGSFLEESAAGDLNIDRAEEIGPIALEAAAPLKFGEHCSAFINSRHPQGHPGRRQPARTSSPASSSPSSPTISTGSSATARSATHIVLQGGVAKNPAVPLAFAQLVGKPIVGAAGSRADGVLRRRAPRPAEA